MEVFGELSEVRDDTVNILGCKDYLLSIRVVNINRGASASFLFENTSCISFNLCSCSIRSGSRSCISIRSENFLLTFLFGFFLVLLLSFLSLFCQIFLELPHLFVIVFERIIFSVFFKDLLLLLLLISHSYI